MNLNDLPILFELLKEENLTPVSVIEGDKVICTTSSGEKYLLKECRGFEETVFTRVFPKIKALNLNLETLQLPEHLKIINKAVGDEQSKQHRRFILLKFYEGVTFNQSWST